MCQLFQSVWHRRSCSLKQYVSLEPSGVCTQLCTSSEIHSTWHFHCMEYVQLGTSTVWNTFNLALSLYGIRSTWHFHCMEYVQPGAPCGTHSTLHSLRDTLGLVFSGRCTTLCTLLGKHYTWHSLGCTLHLALLEEKYNQHGISLESHSMRHSTSWYTLSLALLWYTLSLVLPEVSSQLGTPCDIHSTSYSLNYALNMALPDEHSNWHSLSNTLNLAFHLGTFSQFGTPW